MASLAQFTRVRHLLATFLFFKPVFKSLINPSVKLSNFFRLCDVMKWFILAKPVMVRVMKTKADYKERKHMCTELKIIL